MYLVVILFDNDSLRRVQYLETTSGQDVREAEGSSPGAREVSPGLRASNAWKPTITLQADPGMPPTRGPAPYKPDRRPACGDVQQPCKSSPCTQWRAHRSRWYRHCSWCRHRALHGQVRRTSAHMLHGPGEQGAVLLRRMSLQHRQGIEGRDIGILQLNI